MVELGSLNIESLIEPYIAVFESAVKTLMIVEALIALALIIMLLIVFFNLRNRLKDLELKHEKHDSFVFEMYDNQNYLFEKIINNQTKIAEAITYMDASKTPMERLGIDTVGNTNRMFKDAPEKPMSILNDKEISDIRKSKSARLRKKME